MNRFLPIMLRTDHLTVLFVGGGRVAARKVAAIAPHVRTVIVCALEIRPEIRVLPVTVLVRPYGAELLDHVGLVYACTNSRAVNAAVAADAKRRGLLVNVADAPESSDFVSPAVFSREGLVVSVHSEDLDPGAAVRARDAIASDWEERHHAARH